MSKGGCVYIVSNKDRTVLYIGVTNDLWTRMVQHREGIGSQFTKKYKCHYLLYYETFERIGDAIDREKQLKNWRREWKENLIKTINPLFKDLTEEIAP